MVPFGCHLHRDQLLHVSSLCLLPPLLCPLQHSVSSPLPFIFLNNPCCACFSPAIFWTSCYLAQQSFLKEWCTQAVLNFWPMILFSRFYVGSAVSTPSKTVFHLLLACTQPNIPHFYSLLIAHINWIRNIHHCIIITELDYNFLEFIVWQAFIDCGKDFTWII